MSFEVYVQCFKGGAPSGIARERVRSAFGQVVTQSEPWLWSVRYDDTNGCDIAVSAPDDDDSLVHHLCVSRPCSDRRLFDSLAAVLKLGAVVLYFPGGPSPLVADEAVVADLPPDMVESLGTPVCVGSGDEIIRHIDQS